MMSNKFLPVNENLSVAWAEAFLKLMERGVDKLAPAVITISDMDSGEPRENTDIRSRLDQELQRLGCQSCHTVANTIFPESLWNPSSENNAQELFTRYDRIWPRIKKDRLNRHGVYFRRLMAFSPKGTNGEPVNQLEHIIETFRRGNHRTSALQAGILDPTRDHTHSRQRGFPCLQQIGFVPEGNELHVIGSYPLQYSLERAYGNYLGLCRLGRFMAKNMDLSSVKMTCLAMVLRRSDPGISKGCLQALADDLHHILANVQRERN